MKTRRIRRSGQRGTAMVELAIIAPLLIFTWAAINHFRTQYLMAQQVLHESRTEAWAHATSGQCDRQMTPSLLAAQTLAEAGTFGTEALGIYTVLPGGGSFLHGTATIDAQVGRNTTKDKGPFDIQGHVVGGRTFLHCNYKLPDVDDTLLGQLTPLIMQNLEVQP
jgi:hypothetical protein